MNSSRGRLAPSPTGVLHLGNARSFALAWLDARQRSAELILRIEDLDSPRVGKEFVQETLENLQWLGLDWDGDPIIQSDRLPFHEEAFHQLKEQGLVYPCSCTRKDVEEAASAPHDAVDGTTRYPGTCRDRRGEVEAAARQSGRPLAWRFRTDSFSPVHLVDGFMGPADFHVDSQMGDFVVWKEGVGPSYQLAVVLDDIAQGVDVVVRGDDLLASAARQELLYQAFAQSPPEWIHVPLVVGADGKRLAKRHGDTTLHAFRQAEWTAEEMIGWLAQSCGMAEEGESLTLRAWLSRFDWQRLPAETV